MTPESTRPPLGALPETYAPPPADARTDARADPLRWCVVTTVALLAWLVGPAPVVAVMAALGLVAYARAVRGGLASTRCVLKHPRLVLLYLGAACVAGIVGSVLAGARMWR